MTLPSDIVTHIRDICAHRQAPDPRLSQCLVTEESLIKRTAFLCEQEDLAGQSVLCLGDDDFTSLPLALVGKPQEVVVVDIDDRVLNTIASLAKIDNLPVSTYAFDVRQVYSGKWPDDLRGRFDVVITDPPAAHEGMMLFLALAIHSLRRDGRLYVAVSDEETLSWTGELRREVEKMLEANGCRIDLIERSMHSYEPLGVDNHPPRSCFVKAIKVKDVDLMLPESRGPEFFYAKAAENGTQDQVT